MTEEAALPESKHFHLKQLAAGVYAAVARKDGGAAIANMGLVDLGDDVLIFDTGLSPHAARDLVAIAEMLTGRPVTLAVNSHYHQDHVYGNQALPVGATLYATTKTRDLMATHLPKDIAERQASLPQQLPEVEAELEKVTDENERQEYRYYITFLQTLLADLPTFALRLPNRTFERRLIFHGAARRAELLTFGGGHTASDAALYLPADGILFTGDLTAVNFHPWLGDGNPEEWLTILDQFKTLGPEIIVSGHGPVSETATLDTVRDYIMLLLDTTRHGLQRGDSEDQVADQAAMPEAFRKWENDTGYGRNLRFLYQRLAAS